MDQNTDYAYRTGDSNTITDEFETEEGSEEENSEENSEEQSSEEGSEEENSEENSEEQSSEEGSEENSEEGSEEENSEEQSSEEGSEEQSSEEGSEEQSSEEKAPPQANWKAVIKEADKWAVLSELGFDDFTIGMLKYQESTGDYTPYLEAKTVDYSKMTPEELLRLDLQKKNAGMSERAFKIKLRKEIEDKYYLDREVHPEDSDEAILGQEQMRLDAEAVRSAFIENQKNFKAPEKSPDLDATRKEAELQQLKATVGNSIMNDAATVNLKKAKTLTFGKGEESFHYPIKDVQPLIDAALTTIVEAGRKDLKGLNLSTFYKQLAYGSDPDAFEKAWTDHITAVAKKKFQKGIQNVKSRSQNPIPPKEQKDLTPAQQLAKYGRFN